MDIKDENEEEAKNKNLTNELNDKSNNLDESEKMLKKENEKLKEEITNLKVKFLNMEFEKDTKITKYKNLIKNIEQQCEKVGVKFDPNFNNV